MSKLWFVRFCTVCLLTKSLVKPFELKINRPTGATNLSKFDIFINLKFFKAVQ